MKLYGLDARSAQLSVHISINNFTPEQMVRLTE